MLPNSYEFAWEAHRLVFVGFFLAVAVVLAATVTIAAWKASSDARNGSASRHRWHEDFESLPTSRRRCRHGMTGGGSDRICERDFDCARCPHHVAEDFDEITEIERVHGLEILPDRAYHRGHAWVRFDADGRARIGLDPLARRVIPADAPLSFPAAGDRLTEGDAAFVLADEALRVLTPVPGRVEGLETEDDAPVLVVVPDEGPETRPNLLRGREAAAWMENELRQLQERLLGPEAAAVWADGGAVSRDLPHVLPEADWSSVRQEFFLDV